MMLKTYKVSDTVGRMPSLPNASTPEALVKERMK